MVAQPHVALKRPRCTGGGRGFYAKLSWHEPCRAGLRLLHHASLIARWRSALCRVVVAALVLVVLWPYPAARLGRDGHESRRVVDRVGRNLHELPSPRGTYARWVPLGEISPLVVLATLSSEDRNFRYHIGVDPSGVARALWLNVRERRVAYGGSTVTQQLAKLLMGAGSRRSLGRKLMEARDALRLELWLSKDDILEQYLNRVYYGRRAEGIDAAARRFFGKPAKSLELDEAALLAILPRAPGAYDPERHPERAMRRRAHVLAVLAQRGWVNAEAARRAAEKPIVLVPLSEPRARHVLDALPSAELRGAGDVQTTIDLALTERLERRVAGHLADLARADVDQAAVVVLSNATGQVLAMLGSRAYTEAAVQGAVNGALSRRAPGSTLKPFVYALALQAGKNPASPVYDVPATWRDFQPRNAGREHLGQVSLRDALGSSLNVPAVRIAEEVGVQRIAELFVALGLGSEPSSLADAGLALALGSARVRLTDLANAYATLARGGEHRPWRLLRSAGQPAPARRVLESHAAYAVTRILSDASARRREFGVETPLELPFPVAVKTGTSKSFCDNVVVGYTPELTVAVWVGNFDGRPMHGLLAMRGAAPLFRDVMLAAMEGRSRSEFVAPEGLDPVELCPLSGLARGPSCPTGKSERMPRQHRPHTCDWHGADGKLRVPAELRAFAGSRAADVLVRSGKPISIESPAPFARLRLDALLPKSRQKVALRALVRRQDVARVRWELDGQTVAEVSAPFAAEWALASGRHRLSASALAESGALVARDELEIFVNGG